MDLNPFSVLRRLTLKQVAEILAREARFRYYRFAHRKEEGYANPDAVELKAIEEALVQSGVEVCGYHVDRAEYLAFKARLNFPPEYAGGVNSSYREEKIFEHFIAWRFLGLDEYANRPFRYLDVAACDSPWAFLLRSGEGIQAWAIDLEPSPLSHLDYYRVENATSTSFADASVKGASLQCAFEMFLKDDDIGLLKELSRILEPGGKAVISPLYTHTHYCSYSTPEYWGKGYSDRQAKEYIHHGMRGIPSSRKYDPVKFLERIARPLQELGLGFRLHAIRNKEQISPEIYCHFILEITK